MTRELPAVLHADGAGWLAAVAPFPGAGDQRWRPAVRERASSSDLYVPLAQLKDAAGNSYGDGIAYVEHRSAARRGGKSLYVWMRMPEVLGLNECLYAVFEFTAKKLESTP